MAQEYEYRPLTEHGSIRLIELQPSSDPAAAIRCSLIHTKPSSEDLGDIFTHYTALSYVWGCPDKVETISVEEKTLKVTASLFSALHDLRDETRPFLMWADAICINQDDDGEKGVQVQLMGKIYEDATNTIVYLGPADAESDECRCLRAVRQGQTPLDMNLLFSILNKEWFTRVWVFQELVFAANPWVQCGKTRVRWNVLCKALLSIDANSLNKFHDQRYEIVSRMYQAWESHQSAQKVEDLRPSYRTWLSGLQSSQNSVLDLVTSQERPRCF